jgi:glutaredoxin-like YruB-family protein
MKITVYSVPICPECIQLKEWLKENNVKFETVNVAVEQEKRKAVIEKSGQRTVPITEIDGKIIIGFDKEKLRKALRIK